MTFAARVGMFTLLSLLSACATVPLPEACEDVVLNRRADARCIGGDAQSQRIFGAVWLHLRCRHPWAERREGGKKTHKLTHRATLRRRFRRVNRQPMRSPGFMACIWRRPYILAVP